MRAHAASKKSRLSPSFAVHLTEAEGGIALEEAVGAKEHGKLRVRHDRVVLRSWEMRHAHRVPNNNVLVINRVLVGVMIKRVGIIAFRLVGIGPAGIKLSVPVGGDPERMEGERPRSRAPAGIRLRCSPSALPCSLPGGRSGSKRTGCRSSTSALSPRSCRARLPRPCRTRFVGVEDEARALGILIVQSRLQILELGHAGDQLCLHVDDHREGPALVKIDPAT